MLVIDRQPMKFLLAGRTITVDASSRYRKGGVYAVGFSHRRAVCRVQVVDVLELDGGLRRLTVKRLSGDQVRLMTRNGVVSAPVELNPDDPDVLRGGLKDEPEFLSDEQLRELNRYRADRARTERAAGVMAIRDRVMADLEEALRTPISREDRDKIRAAKHHLGKLGRAV